MAFYRLKATMPFGGCRDQSDFVLYGSPAFRCVFTIGRLQLYVTKLPTAWYKVFFDLYWRKGFDLYPIGAQR